VPALQVGILSSALRYLIKFQGISVGCLCSVLLFKGYFNFGKIRFAITLISICVLAYLRFESGYSFHSCFTNLIISIFTGFVVVNNIHLQNNFIFKILNLKILGIIGMLSYSIYIWQQLFLSNDPKFILSQYPVNLIFVIVVPCLSYFYYERFFLKLKTRFIKNKA
jgi:peptidoglycan/LPS O-acetylase OafA/YrhL